MLTIGKHPAQARHPVTNKPLFDNVGDFMPLLPDWRGVYLDGFCIGYVGPTGNIQFTMPINKIGQAVVDEALILVESEFVQVGKVAAPKEIPIDPEDDDDDE